MANYDRKKIINVIETYSSFVKQDNIEGIVSLFNEKTYFHTYSTDTGAWDEKHAVDKDGVRKIYQNFMKNIKSINVTYTDYIVDEVSNRLAFLVTATGNNKDGTPYSMQNSVLLHLDEHYKIIQFLNWNGDASDLKN